MKNNFKKDRISLLKELRELVLENIENANIDPFLEQDVSEFIAEIKDRRRIRKLKSILKETDKAIDGMISENKLMQQERDYNNQKMIEDTTNVPDRFNQP